MFIFCKDIFVKKEQVGGVRQKTIGIIEFDGLEQTFPIFRAMNFQKIEIHTRTVGGSSPPAATIAIQGLQGFEALCFFAFLG